jgi:hypothetical protein
MAGDEVEVIVESSASAVLLAVKDRLRRSGVQ